jgi:hypothetical protein
MTREQAIAKARDNARAGGDRVLAVEVEKGEGTTWLVWDQKTLEYDYGHGQWATGQIVGPSR